MLEIRPSCENCSKPLPYDSVEAFICTFECTFCEDCVANVLENVCPNCGGGFEKRPIRPKAYLRQYPTSKIEILKPIDLNTFEEIKNRYKDTASAER